MRRTADDVLGSYSCKYNCYFVNGSTAPINIKELLKYPSIYYAEKTYLNFPRAYGIRITVDLLRYGAPAWGGSDKIKVIFKDVLLGESTIPAISATESYNCYDTSNWTI